MIPPIHFSQKAAEMLAGSAVYIRLLYRGGARRCLPYPIRGFSVNKGLCIVSIPHETFCEYQLWAEQNSPFDHQFVFGYTYDTEAYVATKKDWAPGNRAGYEAAPQRRALQTKYRAPPKLEAEQMIKDGIARLWKILEN